ncbi:MAG: hypothetical protein K0U19_05045 [Proteobacteria bacterium]|nr:hypothetical protein [Pseudomonadota bacterium]
MEKCDSRYLLWLLLLCLPFGTINTAWAITVPTAEPYLQYADDVNLMDYRARAVSAGVRLWWQDGVLVDAADNQFKPPAWFSEGFPEQTIDGVLVANYLDDNAIGRILRATEADEGWRKLSFVALDLPEADGGFDERQQQLLQFVTQTNLPNLNVAVWSTFSDKSTLQSALDAMYKAGGEGYLLRHKDSDYESDGEELLLALPYELGEAIIIAHRAGKGEFVGMMGSLEVADDAGGLFVIGTGFSREQRRQPPAVNARIAYKYKGFTSTGKPKTPVFLHVLQAEAAEKKIGGFLRTVHLSYLFIALMLLLAIMDAVTHRTGGRRWNFKSAIVSTGLLGTFIGVFWGLYNFDTSDIVAGVPTLLEGLKLSFVTSIVGIALSTVLSVVQTILGHSD